MRYLTGVYWERGRRAMRNQDSVVLLQVLTARGRVLMAAVCDGMGGLEQGETASGYVTRRLQEWFYASLLRAIRKRKAYWIIRRSGAVVTVCRAGRDMPGKYHDRACSVGKNLSALASGGQQSLQSICAGQRRGRQSRSALHDDRPCAGQKSAYEMRRKLRIYAAGF